MFIDIKNARKHYGDGETLVNALDGVSLSLGEGKIYVILGPSGSGKSTLLNMIGGLDSLDSGEITISGRNISRSDKKKMTDYRREDVVSSQATSNFFMSFPLELTSLRENSR